MLKQILLLLALGAVGMARLPAQSNTVSSTIADDSPQLNPQDKLLYSIQEDPVRAATPEEAYVNAQGEIHFHVSRGADETLTINVQGKTLAAVQRELKGRLEAEYYHRATLDLKLKEQARRVGQVLFTGAVRGNFIQLLPGETKTIFEGVYQVGLSEFANLRKVKLNRRNPQTQETEKLIIDLEAIRKGDRSKDDPLQDGDRVEVPEKSVVF